MSKVFRPRGASFSLAHAKDNDVVIQHHEDHIYLHSLGEWVEIIYDEVDDEFRFRLSDDPDFSLSNLKHLKECIDTALEAEPYLRNFLIEDDYLVPTLDECLNPSQEELDKRETKSMIERWSDTEDWEVTVTHNGEISLAGLRPGQTVSLDGGQTWTVPNPTPELIGWANWSSTPNIKSDPRTFDSYCKHMLRFMND